ncbi:SDR family oxidoreductase [Methylobacterium sp. WL103]|uniref:Enoyl-[acyl-carrier-protein] reductase [NADPH] FabL n=1 Tax=Methylobacterium trifolii TaxID=1003092 RepID=A0ABQ4TZV7_9HYPH|nr:MULTISPECIES: SDR family oxidoreductase [Methylobacterium]KQP07898.1 short-chain dehydrogenase [Methylobacterium sp. Leaf99]TXM69717.1 SDR family oxidoreductase [Methylobacterium sp. WL12]TXM95806.1 SDR family oxidoreductase [Methylobacterium sp. WL103]GJE60794.1 Enoyl-[acyl-carrier-protein] reductase [NADPH] FabL [Methylobacterium trifolii]
MTNTNSGGDLSGKIGLVTGATRNQGRAYAVMLAQNGCRGVAVHYHGERSRGEAEETAAEIEHLGSTPLLVSANLARVSEVTELFDAIDRQFGQLDIVVNTVGKVVKKPFVEITEDDFDQSFAVNTKAAFFCMQEAAKRISDHGRIINIGTTLQAATTGLYSIYAGSKAPLEHFTRALAKEIGARGVTVNTVAPGPLNTSFFYPAETEHSTEFLKGMSVQNRLGEIDEITPLIAFLAGPSSGWVTAQTLFINGGFIAR